MGNTITQYRCAIGLFDGFIKVKENKEICKFMKRVKDLFVFFGPCLLLLFINRPYVFSALLIILLRCGDIEKNPGPPGTNDAQHTKFCHVNARSLLSDTDPELDIDSLNNCPIFKIQKLTGSWGFSPPIYQGYTIVYSCTR